jgi:hypothetical protein
VLELDEQKHLQSADLSAQSSIRDRTPWVDALSLAEGGLLADVAVLLELVRIYLPIAGIAFSLLVPMPFVLLMLRRGLRATALAVAVSTLLVGMMSGPHFGWRMGVSGLVGLALGFAMKVRLRPALVVIVGSLLTSLALYGFFWASIWLTAVPISSLVQGGINTIHAANDAAGWLMNHLRLGGLWKQALPVIFALEDWVIAYWPLVVYLIVLWAAIASVVLYYLIANKLMRFFGYDVRPFPSPRVERIIGKVQRLMGCVFRRLWFWRRRSLETG